MRVIGAAGMSGRLSWPFVNMDGGGGGQVMLVAGREKVHFHGTPDRINRCLVSEFGQSQFRIGRDAENGANLEGQRSTEVYLSSKRPFERLLFFSQYPCHRDQFCCFSRSKKRLEQQGKPLLHTPKCMEYSLSPMMSILYGDRTTIK